MARTVNIPVTDLRIGDIIAPNIVVRTVDACTQRGKIHVNEKLCYDLVGYAEVRI